MPLKRTAADIQVGDHRRDTGGVEQLPQIVLHGILREGIADSEDAESVRGMKVTDVLHRNVLLRPHRPCQQD